MRHGLALIVLVVAGLLSPEAGAAVRVSTTAELRAAVERIGDRAGAIVLERGRYGKLVVGPRSSRARWLTIQARPGALTKHVVIRRATRVKLVGLRVTNYWGGDGLLHVIRSGRVRLEGIQVEGKPGRVARVRVDRSSNVRLAGASIERCGERMVCVQMPNSSGVTVAGSAFTDCAGCDFIAIRAASSVRVVRSTFDQASVGTCERGCWHPDHIQIFGGQHILIEGNAFGSATGGAAQVYISSPYPTDDVVVRGNVFHPGATTGLIVGNPPGFSGLAARVIVDGNQILSGSPRSAHRNWAGVANSLIVSDGYLGWPLEARPIVVGNTFATMSAPELVCATAQVGPEQGC